MGLFKLKVSLAITPQDQTWPATHRVAPEDATSGVSARVSLLAAVDFKWLMTGQGWWVDSARFHDDPSYAATLLGLAMASSSSALQECAARLLAQLGVPAPGNLLPGNGFAASGPGSL